MTLSNSLILFISLIVVTLCLFSLFRSLENFQDIYLGITTSKKEIFRITLVQAFLSSFSVYLGLIIFFTIMRPYENWTINSLVVLAVIPLITISISLIGSYWGFFLTNKYRNWLYKRLSKKSRRG